MPKEWLSPEIEAAGGMARIIGNKIKHGRLTDEQDISDGTEKDDPNVGYHAIVTHEDKKSQTLILKELAGRFPGAYFLTEEKQGGMDPTSGRILDDGGLDLILTHDVFVIDPLDGSSFRNRRLPGWSISIGFMRDNQHIGGAIYAPEDRGGLIVFGERDLGTMVVEYEKQPRHGAIPPRERKKSVVFIGLDLHFLEQFSSFVAKFSGQVQTVSSTTCALGLAYLCAGKIDALIQPVQCPWDWAAGYPLVVGAGGKFQFYHYRNGFPEPMEKPDLASYSPTQRNVAFIAGDPEIVDWLFDLLQKNWQPSDR